MHINNLFLWRIFMKCIIKAAAVAVALVLGFASCDGNITNDSTGSTGSTGTGVYDWANDDSMSEVTEGDYEGYIEIDISEITLSSSLAQIVTSSQLSGAEEVVVLISVTASSAWFNLGTSTSDWSTLGNPSDFYNSAASGETYVLTLTSEGYSLAGEDEDTTYGSSGATGTSPTVSSFSDTGIYAAGENCTISAVYVK